MTEQRQIRCHSKDRESDRAKADMATEQRQIWLQSKSDLGTKADRVTEQRQKEGQSKGRKSERAKTESDREREKGGK